MNILVGDSGATKTDWVLLSDGERQFVQTEGLNPHLLSAPEFMDILSGELKTNLMGKAVGEIYFYGSGCGSDQKKSEVNKYLSEVFEFAEIEVHTDLDAAGLALFGSREGIVCILGSGSSSGLYRNGAIVQQMPSIAFPEGDVGSGSYIGKKLLESYLDGDMDKRLKEFFDDQERPEPEVLEQIMDNPRQAKLYAAHICKVFGKKSVHPEVQEIIFEGFSTFLNNVKEQFPEEITRLEVGFVGSIASVYEGELRACAKQLDIEVFSVIRSPIEHMALHFSGKAH